MTTRIVLTLLALMALTAAPAHASTYTSEQPVRGKMADVVRIAARFWDDRDVHGCVPKLLKAPSLIDSDGVNASGRGSETDCTIWVQSSVVRRARHDGAMLVALCSVVVHETGHARGLQHTPDGIMAAVPLVDPWACVQWAHRMRPARRVGGAVRSEAF